MNGQLDYSLRDAFVFLDKQGDGFLTQKGIRDILSDHGYYATERELMSLFSKFDKDKDGLVSFAEFVEELTPKRV